MPLLGNSHNHLGSPRYLSYPEMPVQPLRNNVTNIDLSISDLDSLVTFAESNAIDYTVVGPRSPSR